MVGAARAEETIVWWDFLSGGDGVRMKAMLDEFNKEHAGKVKIDATTLEWGVPFYTKVQTSAAVGQGPDVMTYHESRMPLGVSTGIAERAHARRARGRRHQGERLRPRQLEGGAGPGRQAICRAARYPLDHPLLQQGHAEEGRPARRRRQAEGPRRRRQLRRRAREADDQGRLRRSRCRATAAAGWRIFYTLLNQQGGEFLKDGKFLDGDNLAKATTALAEMQKWIKSGWAPAKTEYPASIALFTSGKAAMHINGVWEVPTMVDLAKKGKLVRLGRDPDPDLLRPAGDLGRLAFLRHPGPQGQSGSPREAQARARHDPLVQRRIRSNGRAAAMSRPICRCRTARSSRR